VCPTLSRFIHPPPYFFLFDIFADDRQKMDSEESDDAPPSVTKVKRGIDAYNASTSFYAGEDEIRLLQDPYKAFLAHTRYTHSAAQHAWILGELLEYARDNTSARCNVGGVYAFLLAVHMPADVTKRGDLHLPLGVYNVPEYPRHPQSHMLCAFDVVALVPLCKSLQASIDLFRTIVTQCGPAWKSIDAWSVLSTIVRCTKTMEGRPEHMHVIKYRREVIRLLLSDQEWTVTLGRKELNHGAWKDLFSCPTLVPTVITALLSHPRFPSRSKNSKCFRRLRATLQKTIFLSTLDTQKKLLRPTTKLHGQGLSMHEQNRVRCVVTSDLGMVLPMDLLPCVFEYMHADDSKKRKGSNLSEYMLLVKACATSIFTEPQRDKELPSSAADIAATHETHPDEPHAVVQIPSHPDERNAKRQRIAANSSSKNEAHTG